HTLGNRFLDEVLLRRRLKERGRSPFFHRLDVRAAVTNCDPKRFGPILRAPTWAALHPGRVTFDLRGAQTTVSPLVDLRGLGADPVVTSTARGRGCLTT